MVYRAAPITQRDGSSLQNSNCLMAAAATGLDFHTLGDKTSNGKKMRDYSGDTSGGTNTDEIERAWHTGYDEDPITRDGQPWSKVLSDLGESRLVMLQVWHATVGGPCLSGSGAYGHGLAVAPESRMYEGSKQWLVSDPWCKPPKWSWVNESKLKAGAEKWVQKTAYAAGGSLSEVGLAVFRAAAILLMTRYTPANPVPDDMEIPDGVGGPGVLFASTAPQTGVQDVAVNTNGSRLYSNRVIDCGDGLNVYLDAGLTDLFHEFGADITLPYIGPAIGPNSPGVAVLYNTAKPYDDGQARETIVYVNPEHVGEPYTNPEPMCPTDPVAARDAEWRAWLDSKSADAPDKV